MCPEEQKGIVIAALSRIVQHNGLWVVPSQTKPAKSYFVNLKQGTCNCPAFGDFGRKCKHMHAAEIVARREGTMDQHANLAGSHNVNTETEKQQSMQVWPAYNVAQTEEKHRFQALLADLCRYLPPHEPVPGRPKVPLADMVFASVYKVYSTVSTRRFMCDLKDAIAKKYLSRSIHYNSICAFLQSRALTPVLMNLVKASAAPLRTVEVDVAADSTGFSTSRHVRWFDEKYGTRSGHDWVKVHVMVGTKTHVVTAVDIRGRNANEAPVFRKLLKATAEQFDIREVSADKAYSTEGIIEAVVEAGATPYIPFKVNATDTKGGLWERTLNYYRFKQDEFLQHYHKRSNVESVFSMMKAKFGSNVRSRTDVSMKNEVLCKVLAHNICCVIQSHVELGVEPLFWPGDGKGEVRRCTP